MKRLFIFILATISLFVIPNINYGQAPNLGSASGFAIFTATDAVINNLGAYIFHKDNKIFYNSLHFPFSIINFTYLYSFARSVTTEIPYKYTN